MVMLLSFRYRQDDLDIRIESFEVMLLIVCGRFEVNAVKTRLESLCLRQQMDATAVSVSDDVVELNPKPVRHVGESD